MFNVRRLLRDKLASVIDATEPGGSGNPFEGLNAYERAALADLYRLGFPRGAEYMIAQPMGQADMWCWNATEFARQDPGYKIGRASGGERVCQYVENTGVCVTLK